MAEGADCAPGITAKKRQPAARKSRPSQPKKASSCRVRLEKVLGITTASGSGLASDPNTGLVAYPAGCVIVLLHPKKNKQTHIINTCRRPFSALAFSHDGKYLVTGESGHMPCVRVWEVGGAKVAETQSHNYGVSHVAFSINSQYIVSVGYQHDMTVSVWDWRKGSIIASNKVSSRVFGICFSQDSSYFVTAGNRHVKFWYLDASKERRVNSAVPLIGRSGLLGDHRNLVFCGVVCGRGHMALSTYCITSSGLLCLFNSSRQLEAWVNLKTSSASSLVASEDFIFCGCADGVVRVFSPSNLQYIATLPRPHTLGVQLIGSEQHSSPLPARPGDRYPHVLALTFDPTAKHLTCVYNDHSIYVWDVHDVRSVRKVYSALYHSGSVWSIEVYPELSDSSQPCLPPSSFFTCSSDNTIRLWNVGPCSGQRNVFSHDLLKILYVGENTQHLQAEGEPAGADGKAGVRVLEISPDGQHLAAGDRCGNLHIFSLNFLEEQLKIEAHDSEALCLAYSPMSTGVKLLASASRDRLIHIFNVEKNYSLEQTLNDHSGSITAVKFTGQSPDVRMVSCGADKSIYFQTAEQTPEGLVFSRSHQVVEKTTLYDMDLDSSRKHVAIACQDRNIRVYDVETGKMKKCVKGSSGDEGAVIKIQMDPSGSFFATSCSDKNISIFDYESGECISTLFGHSEIATCLRFSQDCRNLITVSGDSCVFVWRLDSHITNTMRRRRSSRVPRPPERRGRSHQIRRETFITVPSCPPQEEQQEQQEAARGPPAGPDCVQDPPLLQTNGKLPMWFRRLQSQSNASAVVQSEAEPRQVRGRWAEQTDPVIICSDCSPSGVREGDEEEKDEEEEFHPQSLEELLVEEEEDKDEKQASGEHGSYVLYTASDDASIYSHRDFSVEAMAGPQQSRAGLESKGHGGEPVWSGQLSPDSACSDGSTGSLEHQPDADTDSLSQGSSAGSLCLEEEDSSSLKDHFEALASSLNDEKFDTDPKSLRPPDENHFLNPRLSISTRFLSRFQDRIRAWPTKTAPLMSVPTKISEESDISNTSVNSELRSEVTQKENTEDVTSRTHDGSPRSPDQDVGSTVGYLGTTPGSGATLCPNAEEKQSSSDLCTSALLSEGQGLTPEGHDLLSEGQHLTPEGHDLLSEGQHLTPEGHDLLAEGQRLLAEGQHLLPEGQRLLPEGQRLLPEGQGLLAEGHGLLAEGQHLLRSSVDPHHTNEERDVVQSPAPPGRPADLSRCDITCSASSEVGGAKTTLQTVSDFGSSDLTLLRCRQLADELKQVARRAVGLHQQLSVSTEASASASRHQMAAVLQEAFGAVSCELQGALQRCTAQPQDRGLLEKYSEELVQLIRIKLDRL